MTYQSKSVWFFAILLLTVGCDQVDNLSNRTNAMLEETKEMEEIVSGTNETTAKLLTESGIMHEGAAAKLRGDFIESMEKEATLPMKIVWAEKFTLAFPIHTPPASRFETKSSSSPATNKPKLAADPMVEFKSELEEIKRESIREYFAVISKYVVQIQVLQQYLGQLTQAAASTTTPNEQITSQIKEVQTKFVEVSSNLSALAYISNIVGREQTELFEKHRIATGISFYSMIKTGLAQLQQGELKSKAKQDPDANFEIGTRAQVAAFMVAARSGVLSQILLARLSDFGKMITLDQKIEFLKKILNPSALPWQSLFSQLNDPQQVEVLHFATQSQETRQDIEQLKIFAICGENLCGNGKGNENSLTAMVAGALKRMARELDSKQNPSQATQERYQKLLQLLGG